MSDAHNWHELIDRHLRGELSEAEQEQLAERLDSDSAAREDFVKQVQWDTQLAEVLKESDDRRALLHERTTDRSEDNVFTALNMDDNHQDAVGNRCGSHHCVGLEPVLPTAEG